MKIKPKIVSSHTADFKPVKQEVNSTVILPPLVFPVWGFRPEVEVSLGQEIAVGELVEQELIVRRKDGHFVAFLAVGFASVRLLRLVRDGFGF